ncbi:MAG: cytochrome b/b6 domain-containing protein [Rhodoferax sp.]|nr:cytochrome b/b6 domain-containing protein [Rhodoferax sp.]
MNAKSASPAESARSVLVWDAPVRVFHWLMVLCFAGSYLTSESEGFRLLHVTLGYTMLGLVVFRLLWGLMGTRYARFGAFIRGPQVVKQYLQSMLQGKPVHHTGHNPLGALSIVAVLALTLLIGSTGWIFFNDLAGEWVAEVHEAAANGLLLVVIVHIAGVLAASLLHRENLARAMVTGRKWATSDQGIKSAWRSVAAVMVLAVSGFWWLQWQSAPVTGPNLGDAGAQLGAKPHDDDD